eukprot:403350330
MTSLSFNKARLDKRINSYVEKQLALNPFGLTQQPMPIHKGKITDMESFEFAWKKIIDEFLKPIETMQNIGKSNRDEATFDSDNQFGVIMSEASINMGERFEQREEITQIVFESLGAHRFAFVPQASLKLFADLKYSGVVVDFGADMTQISPVENGYTSYYSSNAFRVNGNSVDKYLLYSLLLGNNQSPDISNQMSLDRVKRDLKENLWESGPGISPNKYILPDMKQLIINRDTGYDRDALAFLYFNSDIIKEMEDSYTKPQMTKQPGGSGKNYGKNLLSVKSMAISEAGYTSVGNNPHNQNEQATLERKSIIYKILKCMQNYTVEENVQKSMIETVLLTGGGVDLNNLGNLVQMQLETKCIDEYSKINVVQQKEPVTSIIQGAKLYASMKHLDSILITKQEYLEEGPSIVNRKCY